MINQRNPLWRFAGVRQTAWLFFLFLYLPIVVLVALSFNAGQSATLWTGFSLKWFAVVANDPEILRAAQNSLLVAVLATLIATSLATLAALGMHGRAFRGQTVMSGVLGLPLLIEPINTRDMPGFFLNRQDQAHALIAEIGATNVKVQMDLYHCQIVEGDLAMKVRQYLPTGNVGHFQIAGVPERHEPDVGEINYTYLFKLLDQLGYDGWIGCEYRPARGVATHATSDGLGWLKPWL